MTERELFEAALEETPDQRAAFLDRACANAPELRRRLEALLARQEQAGSFLEGAALEGTSAAADWPNNASLLAEVAGQVLAGRYQLLEPIGEGGMGTVWLASQTEPVRRRVAVKLIKAGMDSHMVLSRFEAERQALALMDHANIAKVFDGGATEQGRPFFVMEYVKGIPLTQYCDEACLSVAERLELFHAVCQAVQHAHQKGVIHRDLKPSNLLICLCDGKPVPKVIDFGLAKAMHQPLTEHSLYTAPGLMLGTPLYMSPEQATLNNLDVDTRSDIYALGVVLYELLTGTTPLDKEQLRQAAWPDVLRLIQETEPPRPSMRLAAARSAGCGARGVLAGASRSALHALRFQELDWIVMKALDKERSRRYETVSAFAADIQHYLHDEPVSAGPPSTWYRFRKFARRHKVLLRTATAAALVLLLVAGGTGWTLWDQATRRAELAQRTTETERTVHEALVTLEKLRDQAGQMPRRTSEEAEAILLVWQQAEAALAPALAALNTGTADGLLRQQVLALQQGSARQRARAQRKAKLLRDLDEARLCRSLCIETELDHAGASARYATAFAAYDLEVQPGRTEELARRIRAEEVGIRDALIAALDDWSDNAVSAKTGLLAKQLQALASVVDDDAWRQKYRAAAIAGDAVALRALSREARQLSLPSSCLVQLAWRLHVQRERAEMLDLLRWVRVRYLGDFWAHYVLGELLDVSGEQSGLELEEAIGCYTTALALRPKATSAYINLGNDLLKKNQTKAWDAAVGAFKQALIIDPKFATAPYTLGNALAAKNQVDEAIAEYRKAIELNPQYAEAHNNLGLALKAKDQWDEAIAEYRKAIKLKPKLLEAHGNLGFALMHQNQLDEAMAECRKAIELNPHHPKLAAVHDYLGLVLKTKNQWDEAIAEYKMAIELNPKYAPAHCNLGNAFRAKNQLAEAMAEYRKAIELDPKCAPAHYNLGNALVAKKQLDEASTEYRKVIDLQTDFIAEAHCNLANTLRLQGQLAASLDFYKRGHALGGKRKDWRNPSAQWVADAERLVRLEAKMADVLAGTATPTDNRERLGLAEVCRLQRRHVAAARLSADAFSADPKLVDDLKAGHRYNAACCAALGAAGQGTDAEKLDDQEKSRLRQQALAWLRADLEQWSKRLEGGKPVDRQVVRAKLEPWPRDTDLAGVRDADALKKLSAEEQEAWRQLWADVAELLKMADNAK